MVEPWNYWTTKIIYIVLSNDVGNQKGIDNNEDNVWADENMDRESETTPAKMWTSVCTSLNQLRESSRVQDLVLLSAYYETELVTYILAPTSLRLGRSVESVIYVTGWVAWPSSLVETEIRCKLNN